MENYLIAHVRIPIEKGKDKIVYELIKFTKETIYLECGYFCGFYCNTKYSNVWVIAGVDEDTSEPYMLTHPHYRDKDWAITVENDYQGKEFSSESDKEAYEEFVRFIQNRNLPFSQSSAKVTVHGTEKKKNKKRKWWH